MVVRDTIGNMLIEKQNIKLNTDFNIGRKLL